MKLFRSPVYDVSRGTLIRYINEPTGESLDVDAQAYIDAVAAAKGSQPTLPQKAAINTFFTEVKTEPYWSSLSRLWLPIWANQLANGIDLITLGNGAFGGTITHAAGYMQGDAASGYMDTGTNPTALGFLTTSAWAGYLRTAIGVPVNKGAMGCHEAGYVDPFRLVEAGGSNYFNHTNFAQATVVSAGLNDFLGIVSAKSFGPDMRMIGRNTAGLTAASTATPLGVYGGVNDVNIFLMCENLDGGSPVNYSNDRFGAFWLGDGVSDAHDEAFTLKLKALWEGCTGNVLP